MGSIDHVLAFARTVPWAILPERGQAIYEVLCRRARGVRLSAEEISAVVEPDRAIAAARRGADMRASQGATAVLPVFGTLMHRTHEVEGVSGGGLVSSESLARELRAADANPDVATIVLDVCSPGGSVYGIDELGAVVEAIEKPIVAVANACAASAAYWLASLCDELVVTPSGEVGSIGVIWLHEDHSKELAEEGIAPTFITAGKFKAEGNWLEPLTEESRAQMQSIVDRYYRAFVGAVARGRGVSTKTVESEFGQGRMFGAKDAVKLGMADRVATLDETIARIAGGGRVKKRAQAHAERGLAPLADVDRFNAAAEAQAALAGDIDLRERELNLLDRSSR